MPTESSAPDPPASIPAATAALEAIQEAVRTARTSQPGRRSEAAECRDEALAALVLLRQLRNDLSGWETGLIEAAREAGASWAELAPPLGVANRQSAERRYLRLHPGTPGATGAERVQATRDRRAADRTVTAWARGNAVSLRQLAGQITALTDLPAAAREPLVQALGGNDVAALIEPLTDARGHLTDSHSDLAARVDALTREADDLREASHEKRRTVP